ncbi:MAG TPA: hypothetical protein VFC58_10205 [Desulfosporosinus sp.]|nr:hypothetical protein [Desulfosporosinus sp.]
MKPFYEVGQKTRDRVWELIKKCIELRLRNISFVYYDVPVLGEVSFYLTEGGRGWELIVESKLGTDVYNMVGSMPDHQYSK